MARHILEIGKVERLRQGALHLEENWLRSRGWEHTSSTVGCYWMWERELTEPIYSAAKKTGERTRVYLVTHETACRIQATLDRVRDFDENPELYEE